MHVAGNGDTEGVVIWINGAFGVGKTTVADGLANRLAAPLFDPEEVGLLLQRTVPVPTGDFRDLRAWRHLTAEAILAILHEVGNGPAGRLIVPMSLTDPGHRDEVFGRLGRANVALEEFILTAEREELGRRIDQRVLFPADPARDEAARRWCRGRLDAVARWTEDMEPQARVVDTTALLPAEVVEALVQSLA